MSGTLMPGVYTAEINEKKYTLLVNASDKTKIGNNPECVVVGSNCTMRVWKLNELLAAHPSHVWIPVWLPNEDSSK